MVELKPISKLWLPAAACKAAMTSTCSYRGEKKTHQNLLSPGVSVDGSFSLQIIREQQAAPVRVVSFRWERADQCLSGVGRSTKRFGPSTSAEACDATARRRRVSINT